MKAGDTRGHTFNSKHLGMGVGRAFFSEINKSDLEVTEGGGMNAICRYLLFQKHQTNRWHKVYLYRLKESWETGGPRASLVVRSSTWRHCLRAEFPQP